MGKLSKFVFLLFAVVLSFAGTREVHVGAVVPCPSLPGVHAENTEARISDSKLNKLFCLHKPFESLVNSGNNFPAPDSKNDSNHFLFASFSIEVGIQNIVSQYLLHSKEIYRSLTIGDIIFPFHYFW